MTFTSEGQLIDSQTYDFMADIWQVYLAETYTKSININNYTTVTNNQFFPLHFFFCDNGMFLPLVALQYSEVEIRIRWGPNISNVPSIKCFANYIYLDTSEREEIVKKPMDILVTQVQRVVYDLDNGLNSCDLSYFNHPIKSIFFGFESNEVYIPNDKFSFTSADLYLNGTQLLEGDVPHLFPYRTGVLWMPLRCHKV